MVKTVSTEQASTNLPEKKKQTAQFTAVPTPPLLFLAPAKLIFCVPLAPQAHLYSPIISHYMPGTGPTFSHPFSSSILTVMPWGQYGD